MNQRHHERTLSALWNVENIPHGGSGGEDDMVTNMLAMNSGKEVNEGGLTGAGQCPGDELSYRGPFHHSMQVMISLGSSCSWHDQPGCLPKAHTSTICEGELLEFDSLTR